MGCPSEPEKTVHDGFVGPLAHDRHLAHILTDMRPFQWDDCQTRGTATYGPPRP